jgi:hypothetical protein
MDRVTKIGREIQELSKTELAAFRQWFRDFDAQAWDHQIEEDVQAGKLDSLANKALKDFESGKCRAEKPA